MIIDYVGVKEINGSLIVLDGVKGVSNEEIVDIRLENGTVTLTAARLSETELKRE